MCGLRGGSVLASGLPLVREQFGQPALGVSADALKQIAQISEGVDSESLRSCDEAAEHGGRTAAVLSSLIATSKRLSLDPFAYLRDLFGHIGSHPQSRLAELLPDQWKVAHTEVGGRQGG
jgi:hypothetical protein